MRGIVIETFFFFFFQIVDQASACRTACLSFLVVYLTVRRNSLDHRMAVIHLTNTLAVMAAVLFSQSLYFSVLAGFELLLTVLNWHFRAPRFSTSCLMDEGCN